MIPRLKTLAVLFLAAGVSLGIFASRAIGVLRLDQPAPVRRGAAVIEERVRLYQEQYRLDDAATDLVRQALADCDRRVQAKLWDLRTRYADEFEQITKDTDERIRTILAGRR